MKPSSPTRHTRPPPRGGTRQAALRLRTWLLWLNEPTSGSGFQYRLPRWFLPFLLMFGVGMILISLIGDQGLIAYTGLRGEASALRRQVAGLKERKARLVREIQALQDDPVYLEHMARKKLGLVRPGDVVLQLPRRGGSP